MYRTGYPSVPTLCSVNTGQHILLDITAGESMDLDIMTSTSFTFPDRDWRIRVTQIVCDPNMMGCFQYFTGRTGHILLCFK